MNILPSGPDITVTKSPSLIHYRFRVPKKHIGYTRFILESYEGLGVQSTSPGSDIVTWTIPIDRKEEIEGLLASMLSKLTD